MAIQSFTIKAVSDSALTQILVENGLLLLGEGPPRNAAGVVTSQIGGATLESTGVTLTGRFCFIGIEDSIFGVATTAALIAALGSAIYTGPTIRALIGVSPMDPNAGRPTDALGAAQWTAIKAINEKCRQLIFERWPVEKQNTAIIGKLGTVPGYGDAGFAEMEAWVDSHVAASNVAQNAILAIQPGPNAIAQVEAVTVTWPVI